MDAKGGKVRAAAPCPEARSHPLRAEGVAGAPGVRHRPHSRACVCAPQKKKAGMESINSKLALVMKSGRALLGYKSTLKSLRQGKCAGHAAAAAAAAATSARTARPFLHTCRDHWRLVRSPLPPPPSLCPHPDGLSAHIALCAQPS